MSRGDREELDGCADTVCGQSELGQAEPNSLQ